MILPITLRNVLVLREPIMTVATGGLNFYLGNSQQSTGFLVPFGELGLSSRTIVEDFKQEAENRSGKPLSYQAASRFWVLETLKEIRRDFDHWQQLLLNKFLLFFNGYELTTSINYYSIRQMVPFMRYPWLAFGVISPLALLGFVLFRGHWRTHFPLLGFAAVYLMTNVLIFVSSEYRYAVVPVFMIFAAAALWEIGLRIQKGSWKNLVAPMGLLACFAVVTNVDLLSPDARNYRFATTHYNFGSLLMRLEDFPRAAEEFAAARSYLPDNFNLALAQSDAFYKLGDFRRALQSAQEAYRIDPDHPTIQTT
jgi:hypothetical protein